MATSDAINSPGSAPTRSTSSSQRSDAVVVVPLVTTRGLKGPLTYAGDLPVGAVVDIPLGRRREQGVVVRAAAAADIPAGVTLKPAADTGARVPADLVDLALRIADRYASPAARALKLVLPPVGTPPPPDPWLAAADGAEARGSRQTAIIAAARDAPGPLSDVAARAGAAPGAVRKLLADGRLIEIDAPAPDLEAALAATDEQRAAIARLEAAIDGGEARELLLHGVTGSGKTEVFLRAAAHALAQGRGVILLVPEIALAPQTAARVRRRFGSLVEVLHSGLAKGERARVWQRLEAGEARVLVGARSAILAPMRDLGLIVVDEEHEVAYKQESDPRYDARAVALMRGRAAGAAVVFASATPRPEAWKALEHVRLTERVGGRLPPVELVDLARDGHYPLSRPLAAALGDIERDGGRAMILLNRRGAALALHCRACGRGFGCPSCDVSLVLHQQPPRLVCHHCGHGEPAPTTCPHCGAVDITRIGAGTERLESEVAERFPGLTVLRLDGDIAARVGALEEVLATFAATDRAVLVGTQIVAKGHDFPDVRLAAAIDADLGLALPDFRAEERSFALLAQLAGRAGREGSGGRVLLQTWDPGQRVVRLAARHAVDEFLDGELTRREALRYPPFSRLIRVLVDAPHADAPMAFLEGLAAALERMLPEDDVLGPAPLIRLRDRHRAHLLLRTQRAEHAAGAVHAVLDDRHATLRAAGARVVVDVDPQSV
ncbi:MAG: replication restart helicase PriA [Gaiellales bacterium]